MINSKSGNNFDNGISVVYYYVLIFDISVIFFLTS